MDKVSRHPKLLFIAMLFMLAGCFGISGPYDTTPPPPPKAAEIEKPIASALDTPVTTSYVVKIGMLLPLSGPSKNLGTSMQDAAFMALNDKYGSLTPPERNLVKIVLIPKDTASSPERAAVAASELAREGVKIVLGPVFSAELERVAPILRGIPIISFSNNQTLADNGVFINGFRPEQQIERVISYAASKNLTRFAALLPSDDYGKMVEATLRATLSSLNLSAPNVVYYNPAALDARAEIRSLFEQAGSTSKYSFDGLLIPAGGARLNSILHEISSQGYDLGAFKLLGSGQWDDESVPVSSEAYGGWYAGTDPIRRRNFYRHFLKSYTYLPERLASLAYDATALATAIAYRNPEMPVSALTNPSGFDGPVDGIFRFYPSGQNERGLAVLSVRPEMMEILEPAPTTFQSRP